MAIKYDLSEVYSPDQVSKISPGWCIAVWRLDFPISFDRSTFKSVDSANDADGAQLRGKNPLILVSDVVQASITASKAQHIHQCQASISNNPKNNYASLILPGDWFGIWMVRHEDQLAKVVDALKKGDPANFWGSGLKGIGRVESMGKDIERQGDGSIVSDYTFTGSCFTELDTQIYYEMGLAQAADKDIPTWMAKIGLSIDELFTKDQRRNGTLDDNIHKLIPALFDIMLSKGAASYVNNSPGTNLQVSTGGATNTLSSNPDSPKAAPYAFVVPGAIASTLNRQPKEKVAAYSDLMTLLVGRQEFDNDNDQSPARRFYPKLNTTAGRSEDNSSDDNDLTFRYTGNQMLGAFLPLNVGFVNTPMWQICQQFLNPVCNEMFTAFKADPEGNIVPTVQVRQIPFTTSKFPGLDAPYGVTRFLDLPRWVIPPHALRKARIVRSNATRTNFVRVYGQSDLHAGVPVPVQAVKNGTISDPIDIQRSGLHPYSTMIGCETVSQANGQPSLWMKLVADRMMGSHLTYSGTIIADGIEEPICPGDNIQFLDTVLHIESVTHSVGMEGGNKVFITTLAVSNGLSSQEKDNPGTPNSFRKSNDHVLYSGLSEDDFRDYDGGVKSLTSMETTLENPDDDGRGEYTQQSKATGEFDGFDTGGR